MNLHEKIKTATVTWITYENFGTYLQAYALQKVINDLGYDNEIIDDKKIVTIHSLRNFLSRIKRKLVQDKYSSSLYFSNFRKKHLRINSKWKTFNDLNSEYDIFIAGSDQIWSPYLSFNPYYYLGFTQKKKIGYAPSTGTGILSNEYKENVKPFLEDFSALGVRESNGAKAISSFLDKKIETVLDPTLLLDADEWLKVAEPVPCGEDFILCYFLTPNSWYLDYAREYSKKRGCTLKIFHVRPEYRDYGDEQIVAGPGEFISNIRSAGIVLTDSFHASVFSILFKKDFVAFKRFDDGGSLDQNARIFDLFMRLNIIDYFIGKDDLDRIESLHRIDYNEVFHALNSLRHDSLTFLKNALSE